MNLPNKNKLNIYTLLIVTLSLAFISTFGFIVHKQPPKKPKKKATIHNLHSIQSRLSPLAANKRLLLSKLNKHKEEVIDDNVGQSEYRTIYAISTAYVALCESSCTGITSSGYNVRHTIYYKGMRIIAADTNVIPLYSIVEITYGDVTIRAIALDRGGKINGNHIDLLMKSKQKAIEFGVKHVEIKIIREGKGK